MFISFHVFWHPRKSIPCSVALIQNLLLPEEEKIMDFLSLVEKCTMRFLFWSGKFLFLENFWYSHSYSFLTGRWRRFSPEVNNYFWLSLKILIAGNIEFPMEVGNYFFRSFCLSLTNASNNMRDCICKVLQRMSSN